MKKYWFIPLVLVVLGFVVLSIGKAAVSQETPVPSQSEMPTEAPTETPTATPAPAEDVFDTATVTSDLAGMDVSRWTSESPDGQWTAEFIMAFPKTNIDGYLPMYYTGLIVRHADGKRQWTIIDEWARMGLGLPYPRPVHWSKDGRSFYYTNVVNPDGCTGAFNNGTDLQKVDLESGKVTEVLPDRGPGWIALSPDEKTVAYDAPYGRGLVLRDLATGQERAVSIGKIDRSKMYAVKIIWSPDGKALALTVAIGACDVVEDGESTSILLVDAVSLAVKPIVLEDKRYLVAGEWVGNDRLLLRDPQRNIWSWDRESGELTFVGAAVETPICAATETPTVIPTDTPMPTASPAR